MAFGAGSPATAAAPARQPPARPGRAPVLSAAGVLACLLGAAALLWPMLLLGGPLVYFDTLSYASAGERALDMAGALLGFDGDAGAGRAADDAAGGGAPRSLRSAAWSVYIAALGGVPVGAVLACWLQTAATLLVLGLLVPGGIGWGRALAAALPVATLTGLPWYASYAMPDLLGALLIGFYAASVRAMDAVPWGWRAVLVALASFAILSHYGHLPLAAGLTAASILLRRGRASLGSVALIAAPLAIALVVNFAVSVALSSIDEGGDDAGSETRSTAPSAAPGRLPIVLARVIEDGPGLWHLREACARDLYESCDALEPIPESVSELLWGEEGVRSLGAAEMSTLRAEELRIVLGALAAHPAEQVAATASNVARQLIGVGTDEVFVLERVSGPRAGRAPQPAPLALADRLVPWVTALAAVALLLRLAAGRIERSLVTPILLVLLALVMNAAIFGGLSYPVDRYQGRLAWLVPALLALDLLVAGARRRAGAAT